MVVAATLTEAINHSHDWTPLEASLWTLILSASSETERMSGLASHVLIVNQAEGLGETPNLCS